MTSFQEINGLDWVNECRGMTPDQIIEKAAFLFGLFCLMMNPSMYAAFLAAHGG